MAPKSQIPPANISGPRVLRSSSSASKRAPAKAQLEGSSTRRTPAQVKADKEAKQAQRKAEQSQKHASLVALSQKEAEILQREKEAAANANHPPAQTTQDKAQRQKRLRSPSPEDQPVDNSFDIEEAIEGDDAVAEGEMKDIESDHHNDQSAEDILLDDSDEETVKPKSKRRRGDARGTVHELRAFSLDPPAPASKSDPRKQRSPPRSAGHLSSKRLKTMNIPTGLHDNWNGGVAAYRHSVSIASAMSIDQSADEPGVGNGSDVEMPNGFSDNEEGEQAERAGIKPGHMPRPEDRYQFLGKKPSSAKVVNKINSSLAHVKPTTSVKDFVSPAEAKKIVSAVQSKRKKRDITMGDIPKSINQAFQQTFVPRLLEWAGTQRPWHSCNQSSPV